MLVYRVQLDNNETFTFNKLGKKQSTNRVFATTNPFDVLKICDHNNETQFEIDGGFASQKIIVIDAKKYTKNPEEIRKIKINHFDFDDDEVFVIEGRKVAEFDDCSLFLENSPWDFALFLEKQGDPRLIDQYRQKKTDIIPERQKRGLPV